MPELPEVETVVRELQKSLQGKSFGKITKLRQNIRLPIPDLSQLEGAKINNISRRAKYILIDNLVIHLGMSGKITIGKPQPRQKHDHVVFALSNGEEMVFNDPRRFGLVVFANNKLFAHLGAEPLEDEFDANYLQNKLKNKNAPIKTAIMDQEVVVGVGNIYASEALFMAGISPKCQSSKIKPQKLEALVMAIKKVLQAAIKSGGSTLRDYVRSSGSLGYFQHEHKVYGKEDQPCLSCEAKIRKITQGGRSTFFCPKCQK